MYGLRADRRYMNKTDWTDEELVSRCVAGDARAWKAMIDRYSRLVAHVVRQTLRSRLRSCAEEDVNDIVEDVYAHLVADDCRVLRNFRAPFNLKSWLAVSAARKALDFCKRRRPQMSLDEKARGDADHSTIGDLIEGEELTERRHTARDVREAFEQAPLNPKERIILSMYFFDNCSYSEIAAVAGVPENSIGPTIHRALDKVEEVLRRKGIVPGGER